MEPKADSTTLSRDEVSRLLEIPFNTLAVWRHNGYISQPTIRGATAKQSRYSADDVFAIMAFKKAHEGTRMRQPEAATITRYLKCREGAVETLWKYWPRPVTLTVYPTHDLAAFNVPTRLLYHKAETSIDAVLKYRDKRMGEIDQTGLNLHSQIRYELYEKYPAEVLFADVAHPRVGLSPWTMTADQIREVESRSDPSLSGTNVRAVWVTTVYRNAKNVQYGNIPRYQVHLGGLDNADLTSLSTEDLLTAEAWALQWIDDALLFYGLNGPPETKTSPNYEVDITEELEQVIRVFGEPETPAHDLLPLPEPGDVL